MKILKFLTTFLAVALLTGPAFAGGWNIHQGDEGVFWEGNTNTSETVTGGNSGSQKTGVGGNLTVIIADVSTAATDYVIVPFDGIISRYSVLLESSVTGSSANLTLWHAPPATGNPLTSTVARAGTSTFSTLSNGATITIDPAASDTGVIFTRNLTTNNTAVQYGVLAVKTDGASTGAAVGTVIITIHPN